MRVNLLGHPVAHSLSPAMQNAAFAACELPHRYEALDVEEAALGAALADLRGGDCLGANITVPYKLAVIPALDTVDADARRTGAVNTIVSSGDRLHGYNTDIGGAWHGLFEPVVDSLRGARVALAGAGGGARAVVAAMARSLPGGPDDVVVVARSIDEAERVAELARGFGLPARSVPWADLPASIEPAGVVVNCTPLGLYGEDPFAGIPLDGRVVLDLAYRPGGTLLCQRVRAEGGTCLEGDQMLLHQGVEAFQLWTGIPAPIEAMRAALQREMA